MAYNVAAKRSFAEGKICFAALHIFRRKTEHRTAAQSEERSAAFSQLLDEVLPRNNMDVVAVFLLFLNLSL